MKPAFRSAIALALIGSSTEIEARVPLWGVAVGTHTHGILVPMTTVLTCSR